MSAHYYYSPHVREPKAGDTVYHCCDTIPLTILEFEVVGPAGKLPGDAAYGVKMKGRDDGSFFVYTIFDLWPTKRDALIGRKMKLLYKQHELQCKIAMIDIALMEVLSE